MPHKIETIDQIPLRVAFRIHGELGAQLKKLAVRDANGISATARRLLASAIAEERRRDGSHGEAS